MTRQTRSTPESSSTPAPTPPERVPFEQRAAHAGTPGPILAALRVHAEWAPGREVTQAEYDDALADLTGTPVLTDVPPTPPTPPAPEEVTTDG